MDHGGHGEGSRRGWPSSRDVRHTSVAADMMVSGESTLFYVNQGGTAGGEILPVLDRRLYQDSVMDGFFVRKIFCEPIRAENWRKKWKH